MLLYLLFFCCWGELTRKLLTGLLKSQLKIIIHMKLKMLFVDLTIHQSKQLVKLITDKTSKHFPYSKA